MDKVANAIEHLKKGNVILYPTDTIWGLGCDATNEKAIERIFDIKNRPQNKSFIVLVDSVNMLERYVHEFPEVCYDLIDLTEEPLTIVYEKITGIPSIVLAADGSLGIRVTKDPICQKLIRGIRKPLISTSANTSGEPSPTCFDDIEDAIKRSVDYIVEEKVHEKCVKPSKIIKINNDHSIKILRK
jgi:L-threonylcarbamoyladenylate synthase